MRGTTVLRRAAATLLLLGCSGSIDSRGGPNGRGEPGASGGNTTGSAGSTPVDAPEGARPDGYGEEVDPLAVGFDCDPARDPGIVPLKRLSITEYENTLRDLLGSGAAAAAVGEIDDELAQLPIDGEEEASFDHMDGRISQRHIDGYFNVASALSYAITGNAARLTALAGSCASAASVDAACLRDFITDFGARALRRPLSDEEIARLEELDDPAETSTEVYRGVLFSLLMAPQFLYHFELDGAELEGRAEYLELSPYEVASRLSYHFWQTMPDAALVQAAEDGSLMDDAGYRAQVDRLFADPRTEASVQRFFGDWYRLDIFGGFATTPAFETFASGVNTGDALYADAVAEVEALVQHHVFDTDGSYGDLLQSDVSLTRSPALASLYGVSPWDGSSTPPRLPSDERAGLLTRAAMLISTNHTTNPFKRGAFIRREVLCVPVRPPANLPPGALVPPPFDPTASTRERFEGKVQDAQCSGCHATFTPYGMALEAYDGLGRFRTQEQLIDDSGENLGNVAVDTSVTADIDGTSTMLAGPVELSSALAESELAAQCFARHYFRFTYRREEQIGDECALASTFAESGPDGNLREALRSTALEPAFRRRVWQ
jgi:hypothetical protein